MCDNYLRLCDRHLLLGENSYIRMLKSKPQTPLTVCEICANPLRERLKREREQRGTGGREQARCEIQSAMVAWFLKMTVIV